MKKIDRVKEANGDLMIRVWQCEKFKNDKNLPKKDLHNSERRKIDDILYAVENYFYNRG